MAEIVHKFTADTSDFNAKLNESMRTIQKMGAEGKLSADEMSKAYTKLGKDIVKQMGADGVKQLKKETELAEKEANRLGAELKNALDAAKNGSSSTTQIDALRERMRQAQEDAKGMQIALQGAQEELASGGQAASSSFFERISAKAREATQGMADIKSAVDLLPGPLQSVMGKVTGVMQTFKLMAKIPLLAVINALVYAFQALNDFMHSTTETGSRGLQDLAEKSNTWNTALNHIKGIMLVVQKAAYELGGKIRQAFEDPKQAMMDFVDLLKSQIVNRIEGIKNTFISLGSVIAKVLKGDWDGAKDAISDMGSAMLEATTGINDEQWDKFTEGVKEAKDEAEKLKEALDAIDKRKIKLEVEQINWKPVEAELDERIRQAQTEIYEATDPQKKAEAIAKAQDLIAQKYAKRVEFAKEELAIQQEQMRISPSNKEDYKKEAELKTQLKQLDAQRIAEGMRLTRMAASVNLELQKRQYDQQKELANASMALEKERLQLQKDNLKKSLALLDEENKEKLQKIQEQEDAWRLAAGGTYKDGKVVATTDENGNISGALTPEQEAFLKSQREWIAASTKIAKENTIAESYETTQHKLLQLAEKYQNDIKTLQQEGAEQSIDTAGIQKQLEKSVNEQALTAIQGDSELSLQLQQWLSSLGTLTAGKLETAIQAAEIELQQLELKDSLSEEDKQRMMQIRAQIALATKNADDLKKTLANKKPIDTIDGLKSSLDSCASSFGNLSDMVEGNMKDILKTLSDGFDLTTTILDAIKTCATAEIQSIEDTSTAGERAVKTVENASVILAIIGVVLQVVQKVTALVKGMNDGHLSEYKQQMADLNAELHKMEQELDLLDNKKTIFGDNPFGSFIDSVATAQKYLGQFYDDIEEASTLEVKSAFGGLFGSVTLNLKDIGKQANSSLSDVQAFAKGLEGVQVQTKHSTWFRSAESKSLKGLGADLVGETDEATMERLRKFAETDVFEKLPEQQKKAIKEMLDDWDIYQEATEQYIDFLSGAFSGMADAFSDSIVTAFEEGTDAAETFSASVGDILRDFGKQLMQSMFISDIMQQAQDDMSKLVKSQDYSIMSDMEKGQAIGKMATQTADKMKEKMDEAAKFYEAWNASLDSAGYMSSAEANANTLSGAIAGASQESIDLLSGYCNAVRIRQVESIDLMREQLVTMSGVENNTRLTAGYCERILNHLEGTVTDTESLRAGGM